MVIGDAAPESWEQTRRGFGMLLYRALIAALGARNIHYVTGGIALPNPASVSLHERLGFVKAGHLVRIGRKFDRWIDVGHWQLESADAKR